MLMFLRNQRSPQRVTDLQQYLSNEITYNNQRLLKSVACPLEQQPWVYLERPNCPPPTRETGLHTRSPMFESSQRKTSCDAWKALKFVFCLGPALDPDEAAHCASPNPLVS